MRSLRAANHLYRCEAHSTAQHAQHSTARRNTQHKQVCQASPVSSDVRNLCRWTPSVCVQSRAHIISCVSVSQTLQAAYQSRTHSNEATNPLAHVDEVVVAFDALLFARQHPRCVDDGDLLQQLGRTRGTLKTRQETCDCV